MATRTFTNDAWRGEDPQVVLTATRVKGSGPVRNWDRYEVRAQDGTVLGYAEVVGRNYWATYDAQGRPGGNSAQHPYIGPLADLVWTFRRPPSPATHEESST